MRTVNTHSVDMEALLALPALLLDQRMEPALGSVLDSQALRTKRPPLGKALKDNGRVILASTTVIIGVVSHSLPNASQIPEA